jgi:hypothetical protein
MGSAQQTHDGGPQMIEMVGLHEMFRGASSVYLAMASSHHMRNERNIALYLWFLNVGVRRVRVMQR